MTSAIAARAIAVVAIANSSSKKGKCSIKIVVKCQTIKIMNIAMKVQMTVHQY